MFDKVAALMANIIYQHYFQDAFGEKAHWFIEQIAFDP